MTSAIKAFFSKRKDSRKLSTTSSSKQQEQQVSSITEPQSQIHSGTQSGSSQSDSKDGLNFHFQDGRRYQNEEEVNYVLPNDYTELDRIHQQHWMLRFILQCNFSSPIEDQLVKGIKVLDAGCGPGTWTLEMAETYPDSKFVGIDTSCVFPESVKPVNTEFVVANVAKPLPFPDSHFDFIHQRFLILGLTMNDWDSALQELYRVLKPGGYIELVEPNFKVYNYMGPLLTSLQNKVIKMMDSRGLNAGIALELKGRLDKVGFIYRSEKKGVLKMNHTDKGGELFWNDFKEGYTGLRVALASVEKEWEDPKVYEDYLERVGIECKENKTVAEVFMYCAQKPFAKEEE